MNNYYQQQIKNGMNLIFIIKYFMNGLKRIWKNKLEFITFFIVIIFEIYLFLSNYKTNLLDGNLYLMTLLFVYSLLVIILDLLYVLYRGGIVKGIVYYKALMKAGIVNKANMPPLLFNYTKIKNELEGDYYEATFENNGVSLEIWKDNKDNLESALNRHVLDINIGETVNKMVVQLAEPNAQLPSYIEWSSDYIDKDDAVYSLGLTLPNKVVKYNVDLEPMMLIAGSTGSGKTNLLKTLIYQAVRRDTKVYLIDLKNGVDYGQEFKMTCTVLSDEKEINSTLKAIYDEMIARTHTLAKYDDVNNIVEYRNKGMFMQRIMVVVDELAQLTIKQGASPERKKLIEENVEKLIKISQLGRAEGINLILSTQRSDTDCLPPAVRSNINKRVCGKADKNLSIVVFGDGRADDIVPKNVRGRFMLEDETVFQAFAYQNEKPD